MTAFSADDLQQHADALRRLARDLLPDRSLADDAVQQAFVTALTRPPADSGGLAGWLRAVVRSCALDLRRSEARRQRREGAVASAGDSGAPVPVEAAEQLELQAAILTAVRSLGEPYTTVVWLRYYENLSPTEIAARLGEPRKTIKTRLWRALHALRTRLDQRSGGRTAWLAALAPVANVPLASSCGLATATGVSLMQGKLLTAAAAALLITTSIAVWWPAPPPATALEATANGSAAATASLPAAATSTNPAPSDPSTMQRVEVVPANQVAPGPAVQVVVRHNGQPVRGVQVFYDDPRRDNAFWQALTAAERRRLNNDAEALLQRVGTAVTTDADGLAQWPWLDLQRGSWHCMARSGELYAETYISTAAPASEHHELHLLPDREFVVQVLDAHRQPAVDVLVTALHQLQDHPDAPAEQTLGSTEAAGLLSARHVQLWSDRIAPRGNALPVQVRTRLPGIDVRSEIDVARLPTTPVVLQLPASGTIEVRVLDAFGEPLGKQALLLQEDSAPPDRKARATTDERGMARFPFVGLGKAWRLDRDDHRPPEQVPIYQGPQQPDEVVQILLQPQPAPFLTGQLLRDGAPAGATQVSIVARGAYTTTTDTAGRFRVALDDRLRDQHLTELTVRPHSKEHGVDGTLAVWRGDTLLSVGPHDLGVLDLQPEPLVATVQFVSSEPALPAGLGFAVEAAMGPAEHPWQTQSLSKRFEPDGRFSLFGTVANAPLRLSVATENQFLPVAPVPFVAGARDLRIELQRGGSVRATLQAGSQIEAFCLQPLLVPTDRRTELLDYERFVPGRDARMPGDTVFVGDEPLEQAYTWPAVAPGRYRLEVRTRGIAQPLLVVPDVLVVDGERNAEARLQHLTVPSLQAIELTLPQAADVAPAPNTQQRGVVAVLIGDVPGDQIWQVDNANVFFAATQPIDVLVRLSGYRDRILRGIRGKQTIALQPGLPVTLRSDPAIATAGQTLRLELEGLDDPIAQHNPAVYSAAAGGGVAGYQRLAIAADSHDGVASMRLPRPGRYRLTATRREADGTSTVLRSEPAELQVGDDGGTFAVQLTR